MARPGAAAPDRPGAASQSIPAPDAPARPRRTALVLSGERSPQSTRRVAERLAAALPNGAAVQTKGGHMAPITHAAVVNPLLAGFLAGAEIASA